MGGRWRRWAALALVAVVLQGVGAGAALGRPAAGWPERPRPPEQPVRGPGGQAFAYEAVEATRVGTAPLGYWLFEPASLRLDGTPPAGLPVVVFLHGYTALDPDAYRDWIDHIVRRGAVVVYPDYQTDDAFADDWQTYLPNLVRALRGAFAVIGEPGSGGADLSRVAVVGHSLGGVLAVALGAVAAEEGLPVPRVLMPVQPGGCAGCRPLPEDRGVVLPELERVEPETLVVMVVGEDDGLVGDDAARTIWQGLRRVPLERRDYVTLVSDGHGSPPLEATHLLAQTGRRGGAVDALDFFGTWKLFDLVGDCAFAGIGCEAALGGSAQQRAMGVWSDGEPVEEARVTDYPDAPG